MKFVVYGRDHRLGLLRGGEIADVAGATAKYLREKKGEPLAARMAEAVTPSDLEAFIEGGDRALDQTRAAMDYLFGAAGDHTGVEGASLVSDAKSTMIHAPKPRRARVGFCGGNFPAHSRAMAINNGHDLPKPGVDYRDHVRARGFWGSWKIERDAQGPEGKIIYPNGVTRFDYEGKPPSCLAKRSRTSRPRRRARRSGA